MLINYKAEQEAVKRSIMKAGSGAQFSWFESQFFFLSIFLTWTTRLAFLFYYLYNVNNNNINHNVVMGWAEQCLASVHIKC